MKRPSLLDLLPLLAITSCVFGTDETPPVVPGPAEADVRPRTVSPEIERFFRSNAPASGTRLMAGDRIEISVQGKPELSVPRDVPPNGEIPVYKADRTVNALGRTVQQLEADIAAAYATMFEKPYVTVNLMVAAPRSVYVVGAVKTQGSYPVSGNDRLTVLQALALAGGITPQSDLRSVTVQRIHPPTNETVTSPALDIQKVMDNLDQRDNLIVEPGDTIVVPDLVVSSVQVLGHVEKQGSVAWSHGMTLSRAITEAGGFRKFANKGRIKIVRRGRERIEVNFEDVLDRKAPDLELEPRDVVYVDEKWI